MQKGTIRRCGNIWLLHWKERVVDSNGKPGWKSRARKLADVGGLYMYAKDCEHLAEEFLRDINLKAVSESAGATTIESTLLLNNFLKTYLDRVSVRLKPSTAKGYREMYRLVMPHLGKLELRRVQIADIQRIMRAVAQEKARAHTTYRNLKSFLSGAFKWARQEGLLDKNNNPVRDAEIPRGKSAGETYAYSLAEVQAMIAVLEEPARTAVLVAALTGLRHSEIRGLRWEDFSGDELMVRRGVWGSHVSDTKTLTSKSPVPLLPIVREALEEHKTRNGADGFVFHGETGKPLVLANVVRRDIIPALEKAKIQWHGWHAFRRGLATNLYSLGAPAKTVQAILRHADLDTTMAFYVKPVAAESQAAMAKLEKAFKASKTLKTA
jgi:integrase